MDTTTTGRTTTGRMIAAGTTSGFLAAKRLSGNGFWALFGLLTFLVSALGAPTSLFAQASLGAAALVNDEVITGMDLSARTTLLLADRARSVTAEDQRRIQPQVLDALINEKLQVQEAKRLGVVVPQQDIDRALESIARRNRKDVTGFLNEMRGEGILPSTLLHQIEAQLSWQFVVARRFRAELEVSDEEVEKVQREYDQFRNRRERLLSEIYLPTSGTNSPQQAFQTAASLAQQVRSGKNFGLVAQQFSQARSALNGGDIGWVIEGTLDPDVENALRATKTGEVTQPIRTPDGVLVYAVRADRPVGQRQTGETANMLQLFFSLPEDLNSFDAQKKLARAAVLINTVKGCDQFKTAIERFGDTGSGDMGAVDLSKLPPALGGLTSRIEVGRVSPPYPVPNGAALFMICGRGELTSPITNEEVRNRLLDERLNTLSQRYLRDLRRQAFIDLRK